MSLGVFGNDATIENNRWLNYDLHRIILYYTSYAWNTNMQIFNEFENWKYLIFPILCRYQTPNATKTLANNLNIMSCGVWRPENSN